MNLIIYFDINQTLFGPQLANLLQQRFGLRQYATSEHVVYMRLQDERPIAAMIVRFEGPNQSADPQRQPFDTRQRVDIELTEPSKINAMSSRLLDELHQMRTDKVI